MHDIYKGYIFAQDNILGRPFHKRSDFYNLSMLRKAPKVKLVGTADKFIGRYICAKKLEAI